jgi:hypothetical protein
LRCARCCLRNSNKGWIFCEYWTHCCLSGVHEIAGLVPTHSP